MPRLLSRLRCALHATDLPFLILWLASLLAAILVFRDFGLAWDEPLFYQYSDAVGTAYSIPDWLAGTVDLNEVYGPSAEDHKFYGAAYLLIGRNVTRLIQGLSGLDAWTVWHLTNFLFFELGVLVLYFLCKRWMSASAATFAATLYLTQPVVWGHAFINPKDVPFATLFILAVYSGFRMVDRLSALGVSSLRPAPSKHTSPLTRLVEGSWPPEPRLGLGLALGFGLIALLLAVFGESWRGALGQLVRYAYAAPPDSDLGRAFAWLARSRDVLPLDYYLGRVYRLYRWVNAAIGVVALTFAWAAWAKRFPGAASKLRDGIRDAFTPLPTWPSLARPGAGLTQSFSLVVVPGILLGMLSAVRVLGPLAALLVILAYLLQPQRRSWVPLIGYVLTAGLTTFACWPYLWAAPFSRFLEVYRHMADNPKVVPVLFDGAIYASTALPPGYLPRLLALTLTEPVWPLALMGLGISLVRFARRRMAWSTWIPILLWFAVPFGYVLARHPAMYDGYRHFLFLLPPVFIACGLAFDAFAARARAPLIQIAVGLLLLVPGILGIIRLHPYAYAYYNDASGGTAAAFRRYETEYWLTCYKEAAEALAELEKARASVFVQHQPAIARYYLSPSWQVELYDYEADRTASGSYLLLTTRANRDLSVHPNDPVLLTIGRQGAVFCLVRRVP